MIKTQNNIQPLQRFMDDPSLKTMNRHDSASSSLNLSSQSYIPNH